MVARPGSALLRALGDHASEERPQARQLGQLDGVEEALEVAPDPGGLREPGRDPALGLRARGPPGCERPGEGRRDARAEEGQDRNGLHRQDVQALDHLVGRGAGVLLLVREEGDEPRVAGGDARPRRLEPRRQLERVARVGDLGIGGEINVSERPDAAEELADGAGEGEELVEGELVVREIGGPPGGDDPVLHALGLEQQPGQPVDPVDRVERGEAERAEAHAARLARGGHVGQDVRGQAKEVTDPALEPGLGGRQDARPGARPGSRHRLPEDGEHPLREEPAAAQRLGEVDGGEPGVGRAGGRECRGGDPGVAAQERVDGLREEDVGDGIELGDEVVDRAGQLGISRDDRVELGEDVLLEIRELDPFREGAGDQQPVDDARRGSILLARAAQDGLPDVVDVPVEVPVVEHALEPRTEHPPELLAGADALDERPRGTDLTAGEVDGERRSAVLGAEGAPSAPQDRGGRRVVEARGVDEALARLPLPGLEVHEPAVGADLEAGGARSPFGCQPVGGQCGHPGVDPVDRQAERAAEQPLEHGNRGRSLGRDEVAQAGEPGL